MSIHARPICVGGAVEAVSLPPEIAFLVSESVSPHTLRHAAKLARESGTDAATALLNTGLISEDAFYRALARSLGTRFLSDIPLGEETRYPHMLEVSAAPLAVPLAATAGHTFVAAPRGHAIGRLIDCFDRLAQKPAITTPTRLRRAAFARHGEEIAATASDALNLRRPEWSCRPGAQPLDLALAGAVIALLLAVAHLPNPLGWLVLAVIQVLTLALLTVRLSASLMPSATEPAPGERLLGDDRLPTYTVIVALYREAKVVPRLIYALSKLDYPAAKLQVMFVIEAGDTETAAAFAQAPMPARFEVVTVPPGLPKTKPRALNVALTLARGDLLVVYDAEDVVDPLQLRLSASIFSRSPSTLGGIQGRLVIDNTGDGLLTKFFAIEYSALFDVLGPALASWRMPTPLGGTTTHFRGIR